MTSVAVLVPVLGRPGRARLVAESIAESDPRAHVLFLCSPDDDDEIAACRETTSAVSTTVVVGWESGRGDYARKMNYGFEVATPTHEWVFLGADDLVFHTGWLDACLRVWERTYACVIGTNDLGNSRVVAGHHSTHTLVHREYLDCGGVVDDPTRLLCERYDHNFCNPPEAPIWMADCSFRALGDVEVGDVVVGWERIEREGDATVGTPRRCLAYSEVLAVKRREAPLVRVVMESGREFRCTPDHRWLNARWSTGSRNSPWVTPRVGRTLLHVVDVPERVPDEHLRTAGWLAGIYDGEGSGIYIATQSKIQNPQVVAAIRGALEKLAVPYSFRIRPSGIVEFVLTGGRQGYLDFLTRIDPVRRKPLEAQILGYRSRLSSRRERLPIGARRFGHNDKVVAVEDAGRGEVVSMTTSTGNYVAWGYASRNCDDEFVQTAMHRDAYAHAHNALVEHLHPNWAKGQDDATYRKGMARFAEDQALFHRRSAMFRPRLRVRR